MAFREKSAWLMLLALTLTGSLYVYQVATMSSQLEQLASPSLPSIVTYTILLVVVATLGHIIIAGLAPKEANAASDEREQIIIDKAGRISGYVLATGIVLSLGFFLVSGDGNVLFYGGFGSLMLSQLAEYALRICFYRSVL